ncbi:MAG: spermine synthase [Candidatus Peregrinibacteria bacterium Greene0416_62]|nr:MAG: spermine synthase [Candidatus Peregrinibacteria bacterium Greene0416_62]TSD00205.1 MAG: spermine synthase [Candidatus Peregrinibacteria bacterium Greene1014_49]
MLSLSRSGFLLRALVTYTGACVLVIEILATRILAPHFGSSLYTLSSVLGVTLGALSIGYYAGGILADRNPSWYTLGILLTFAGVTTLLIWPLSIVLLPLLGSAFASGAGPLMGSTLLFLIPCGFLGTFSPYAVGLEQRFAPALSAGRAAGNIFFWSTLGSIAGSIAAGFLLIPLLGIHILIGNIGTSLLVIGIVIVLLNGKVKARGKGFIISSMFIGACSLAIPYTSKAVFAVDGVYQRMIVQDTQIEDRKIRILWQDRNASSGINLENDDHAFQYTRIVAAAWKGKEPPKRSLVIGAGAFVIPRVIAAASPESNVDVIDIEPGLEDIAKRFFRYIPSDRIHSIIADGRTFLRDSGQYDLIIGDAYQATHSIPAHLTTQEFFALVKDHLTENGIFIGNFIGSVDTSRNSYLPAVMRTLLSVFPAGRFYAMNDSRSVAQQNVMFIACKSDPCIDPCSSAMKSSPDPILSTLCERDVPVYAADLEDHPILTDDYAPVEWLTVQ